MGRSSDRDMVNGPLQKVGPAKARPTKGVRKQEGPSDEDWHKRIRGIFCGVVSLLVNSIGDHL
jgi:hypothetical protein